MGKPASKMTQIEYYKLYNEDEGRVIPDAEYIEVVEETFASYCKEKYGKPLNDIFDAKIWAEEFVKTVQEHPDIPTDVDSMLGWFANAIMAGYDEAYRIYKDKA